MIQHFFNIASDKKQFVRGRFVNSARPFINEVSRVRFIYFFDEISAFLNLSDYQWCLNNDINPGTFFNWVKRLRKNGCGDIPEKNQLSTYEQSHQEVVKIEMNSISVPTDMNKNTNTATMELMIGMVWSRKNH